MSMLNFCEAFHKNNSVGKLCLKKKGSGTGLMTLGDGVHQKGGNFEHLVHGKNVNMLQVDADMVFVFDMVTAPEYKDQAESTKTTLLRNIVGEAVVWYVFWKIIGIADEWTQHCLNVGILTKETEGYVMFAQEQALRI